MSRNDARKFLAQGTASALTLALGLTFAAQPAFAETAKAADPAPSASAAPSAPAADTNPGLSVDPTPAAPVVAPAPSDGPSPEAPAPAPSEKPAAVVFKDVPQTHMFYQEITWLGQTGISTGWPDGTFRPSQNIERAAIAAYFYRMAGSPDVVLPKQSPFTDVAPSDPFYKEIVWMHQQHITTGWSDGTFRPHDSVTREALAAFFYRAANMNDDAAPTQDPFKDVTSKSPFYREIAWFKAQKITTGWPDGTFRPHEPVTREATAAFVFRFAKI